MTAPGPIADAILARRPAFLVHRWADLTKMRKALNTRDFDMIQTLGHNSKGTGAGYGFPALGEVGSKIEAAARVGDTRSLEESLQQFENCVRAAAAEIGLDLEV